MSHASTPTDLPDLAALVIRLRVLSPLHIRAHWGRAVYQFGLTLLGRADALLAQTVHDLSEEKPFTASGLMRGDAVCFGALEVGEEVWVRFTGLSAEVVAALRQYEQVTRQGLEEGKLIYEEVDRLMWQVIGVTWQAGRVPGCTRYQTLIERHSVSQPETHLTLAFLSATTFRSTGVNVPLPRPDLVFGSLLARWEQFTQHRLHDLPHDQLEVYIRTHVVVSRFDARTAIYQFKQGGKEIGFTGAVTFELLPKSDYLLKQDRDVELLLRRNAMWFARAMHLFAEFAHFSGVGRKTTTGMGMART